MPAFEEQITTLAVQAFAADFVLLIAAAFFLRQHLADIRRDWKSIDLHVGEPVALAVLTLIAALLRVTELSRAMGADESATFLYYASKPFLVGISVYGSPNNHLLHTALTHLSSIVFGDAEWALRLPAFVAGVAMVPLVYVCGGGLQAAAATAAWPAFIDYSTDARGYTLLCCFVLICTFSASRIRTGNRAAGAVFAISAALGFFTVPVMIYPFVMLLVWCGWRRETLVCAIASLALTLMLYLPALMVSGIAAIASNGYVRPLPAVTFFSELPRYVRSVGGAMFVSLPLLLSIVVLLAFIAGVVRRRSYWPGFLAVIVLILLQRVLPFPRIWLPFLALMLITAAQPLPKWPDRGIAAALLIALATCAYLPRLRETGELRAVREIVRELRIRSTPGDPVIALPPSEMPLTFYAQRAGLSLQTTFPDVRRPRIFAIVNRDYGQRLRAVLDEFHVDPRTVIIRRVRDFGSSALYEVTRR